MTITIHLVRHAQGFHNLSKANEQMPDPSLTPLGEQQCADLAAAFPHHARLTHLVASPLRRTLLTCHHAFLSNSNNSNKNNRRVVVAQPLVQEVSTQPCDTGSAPAAVAAEFGAWADCGLLRDGWNDKTSPGSKWAPTVERLEARAREARVWLRGLGAEEGAQEDVHVVVVSHGGFLHFLTQDWDGMDLARGTGWDNCEYRSYEFVDPDGADAEARLRETPASWRRRRGSAAPLSETEQQQARAVVVERYHQNGWSGSPVPPE